MSGKAPVVLKPAGGLLPIGWWDVRRWACPKAGAMPFNPGAMPRRSGGAMTLPGWGCGPSAGLGHACNSGLHPKRADRTLPSLPWTYPLDPPHRRPCRPWRQFWDPFLSVDLPAGIAPGPGGGSALPAVTPPLFGTEFALEPARNRWGLAVPGYSEFFRSLSPCL